MNCLFLTDDLLFSQQVSNAISAAGSGNKTVASMEQARSAIQDGLQPNALVVDLNLPGLVFADAVELSRQQSARCVGVVSHVHQGKIDRAKEAGFDHILTRGQIAERLGQVIRE